MNSSKRLRKDWIKFRRQTRRVITCACYKPEWQKSWLEIKMQQMIWTELTRYFSKYPLVYITLRPNLGCSLIRRSTAKGFLKR